MDVDTSKKTAKVYKGVNNTATPELIETISLEPPKGNITPPPPGPVYLRVKTSGGYEAFVSLVYRTKDGQQKKLIPVNYLPVTPGNTMFLAVRRLNIWKQEIIPGWSGNPREEYSESIISGVMPVFPPGEPR